MKKLKIKRYHPIQAKQNTDNIIKSRSFNGSNFFLDFYYLYFSTD